MPNKNITFEAFKASKQEIKTVKEFISKFKDVPVIEENLQEDESLLVYVECMQIIKDNSKQNYYLILGNQEFESEDLTELEKELFEFYKDEILYWN